MSITRKQAEDLLSANYSPAWSWDDPEWWEDMVEFLMEFRSVKHLRHGGDRHMEWRVPPWWPGQSALTGEERPS